MPGQAIDITLDLEGLKVIAVSATGELIELVVGSRVDAGACRSCGGDRVRKARRDGAQLEPEILNHFTYRMTNAYRRRSVAVPSRDPVNQIPQVFSGRKKRASGDRTALRLVLGQRAPSQGGCA